MREILFRAMTIPQTRNDFSKMVYGTGLFFDGINHWLYSHKQTAMASDFSVKIISPDTIGQFTGLTDKNGKKIFEGDILQGDDDIEDDVFHVARIGQSDENRYECFLDFNGDNKCWIPFIRYFNRMEIIGNIHDNPELMEVTE